MRSPEKTLRRDFDADDWVLEVMRHDLKKFFPNYILLSNFIGSLLDLHLVGCVLFLEYVERHDEQYDAEGDQERDEFGMRISGNVVHGQLGEQGRQGSAYPELQGDPRNPCHHFHRLVDAEQENRAEDDRDEGEFEYGIVLAEKSACDCKNKKREECQQKPRQGVATQVIHERYKQIHQGDKCKIEPQSPVDTEQWTAHK